jgi:hypothetical protein
MPPLTIFVKIGALWRFNRLQRDTRGLPVAVQWDRRRTPRRSDTPDGVAPERRAGDRRAADPPFTWTAADFVVVPKASGPTEDPESR